MNIDQLLKTDALSVAEEITGKSYKTDEETSKLGMGIQMTLGSLKTQMLTDMGDSCFRTTETKYIEIIESIGFKEVYKEDFIRKSEYSPDREDTFYIFFDYNRNIILSFDTYGWSSDDEERTVNGSNFFFNLAINSPNFHTATSSGHMMCEGERPQRRPITVKEGIVAYFDTEPKEPIWGDESYGDFEPKSKQYYEDYQNFLSLNNLQNVWQGHNDGREAVRHQIEKLDSVGDFIKWVEFDDTLIIYLDGCSNEIPWKDEDSVGWARFNALPDDVKKRLGM